MKEYKIKEPFGFFVWGTVHAESLKSAMESVCEELEIPSSCCTYGNQHGFVVRNNRFLYKVEEAKPNTKMLEIKPLSDTFAFAPNRSENDAICGICFSRR